MPATKRQEMLLKFWGNQSISHKTKDQISEWIESWQADSYDDDLKLKRHCAWMLFKHDNPQFDREGEGTSEDIPDGVGTLFMEKVSLLEKLYGVDALESLRCGELPDGYAQSERNTSAQKPSRFGLIFAVVIALLSLAALALLTGCQLPVTSKTAIRQHQVEPSFTVNAPFIEIAKRWDDRAEKPMLGVLNTKSISRLQIYESLGLAEITLGDEAIIYAMVELKKKTPTQTLVTVYDTKTCSAATMKNWLEIIRSTPSSAPAP